MRKPWVLAIVFLVASSFVPLLASYGGLFCGGLTEWCCLPVPEFHSRFLGLGDTGYGFPFQIAIAQNDVGGSWSRFTWYPLSAVADLVVWLLVAYAIRAVLGGIFSRRRSR